MRPNLFNVYHLFATIGVTIIVALFLSLLYTVFNVHTSSLLHYRTSQNTSQVSVKLFQISKAKWTPVLINKIWYYRMLQKSRQVVSEQILTLHFRHPSFLANHLFNVAPKLQSCSKHQVMFFKSCPEPVWGWGPSGSVFKDWGGDPRGFIYCHLVVQNQQTGQLI